MRKPSIQRRLGYGFFQAGYIVIVGLAVAAGLVYVGEYIAHRVLGPTPPSGVLARVSQCGLKTHGATAMLDCEGHQSDLRFATVPTPGKPRVVFLGGSTVREPHISGGKMNFPTMIAQAMPGIEVLNFGSPGMQAASIAVLSSQLEPISPDLVVIYAGHNDYNNDVFLGKVGGIKLWMIPVLRWLSKSWAYAALTRGSRPTAQQQRTRGGLIGTQETLAFEVRESVDERLESDLSLAIEESPAPVLLATLLRNSGDRPAGVIVTDRPECEAALPHLGPDGSSPRGKAELAQRTCPNTSISHWWQAQAYKAEGQHAQAIEQWYASLDTDPVPLRAPATADRVIRAVATNSGATLIDLEQNLGPMADRRYFVDTVHFSPAGARAIAQVMAPVIQTALEAQRK